MPNFGYTEWYLQLINGRTRKPIDDDSGVVNVLTNDDPSEVTIYDSATTTTAGSNPATFTNGIIQFWTASGTTTVDLSIQTANGHAFWIPDFVPSLHRVVVWPEETHYTLVMPYQVVGASETVVDTGFDVLGNMLVRDCFVHVTTAGTGASLDIGTSTDTDGFVNGVDVSSTGYPVTLIEEALVSGSGLLGTLLANETGTDVRKLHRRANSTSGANIIYINTASSSTAGEGYIYMTYIRIPTTAG